MVRVVQQDQAPILPGSFAEQPGQSMSEVLFSSPNLPLRGLEQGIVVRVSADPEPEYTRVDFQSKGPVLSSYSYRTKSANLFEMQGRMLRIRFQQFKLLPRQFTTSERQFVESNPEFWRS